LKIEYKITSNLHTTLLICAIFFSAQSGLCRTISIEIGPIVNFSSKDDNMDVPAKSPHSFDDFQYTIHVQPNRFEAKNISLGIKYFAGETTVKQSPVNPLILTHISSHLWSAYVSIEKLVFENLSDNGELLLDSYIGLGIISERVGFTNGYSLTSDGIAYNLSTGLSYLPTNNSMKQKIRRYYMKLNIHFLKDTFDYENLHIDQSARIEEFRKLILSEIGIDYRWFGSVSVILFGRVCHYDKSSRVIIGSGLNF
jgi:hypothetical protein